MYRFPPIARAVPPSLHGDGRFVLPRREFAPCYVRTYGEGRLREKAEEAIALLEHCTLCPRNCRVDRLHDKTAACKTGRYARVASAFPHFGEEDCLRGWKGSGTIFFAWCNLRCVFCQNFETSQTGEGEEVSPDGLAGLMLKLQAAGCHNINFVTPEHVVPQILEAIVIAVERGLHLPLVYNTSAYDSLDSIRLMDGVVDVYMPDFKIWTVANGLRYLFAKDYAETARRAVKAMHDQVGELKVDEEGIALRGVLVRHLVMPGLLEETREIMNYLAHEVSVDTYLNLMDQYRPAGKVLMRDKYGEINRRISGPEWGLAMQYAREAGLWRLDERRE